MKNTLENIFGKSWRTTLTGWISGAMPAGYALMDAYQQGQFTGKSGLALAFGIMIVIRGYLVKDAAVTGLPKSDKDNGCTTQ